MGEAKLTKPIWIELGHRGNEFYAYLQSGFDAKEVSEFFKTTPEMVIKYAERHERWVKHERCEMQANHVDR